MFGVPLFLLPIIPGLIALGVEGVEIAAVRELEALASETALHALLVAVVFLQVGIAVVAPHIGHVFPEEHHEDVVPVVFGIDNAPEGVAGAPGDFVDLGVVVGGLGHGVRW